MYNNNYDELMFVIVQLLHRLKIRSSDGNEMLLKVIKNPISRHLPVGAKYYGISSDNQPIDL
jgi:rRNA small subunit pseudouridine methyltransferase Nep1